MKYIACVFALTCAACGGSSNSSQPSAPSATPKTEGPKAASANDVKPASATATDSEAKSEATAKSEPASGPAAPIVESMRKDAIACYTAGKKSNPTMGEGRVILNVAARDGHASCVIPSEGAGLSSEVEGCLASRLARETFPAGNDVRMAIPLEVKEGDIELAKEQPRSSAGIESLETHGVDRAGIVVMKLMEQINECVLDGMAKKPDLTGFFYVHAKIDGRGNVACAVANRGNDIPDEIQKCAMETVSKWHFPRPKRGSGSVTIPIKIGKKT